MVDQNMTEDPVQNIPLQAESPGSWLKYRIESQGLLKKDICAGANIEYKTLRSYINNDTTPTLTANQWFGFAEALQIDLKILMHKFTQTTSALGED